MNQVSSEQLMETGKVEDLGKLKGVHYHRCVSTSGQTYLVRESGGLGGFDNPVAIDSQILAGISNSDGVVYLEYARELYDDALFKSQDWNAQNVSRTNFDKFVDYTLGFYGPDKIYDYGFTREEVDIAAKQYLSSTDVEFEGDTIDREIVRDMVLSNRKLKTEIPEELDGSVGLLMSAFTLDELKQINVGISYEMIKRDFLDAGESSYLNDTLLNPSFFSDETTAQSYAQEIIEELGNENFERVATVLTQSGLTDKQEDVAKKIFEEFDALDEFEEMTQINMPSQG